jgi:ferritin-like metal-binding protein YciE
MRFVLEKITELNGLYVHELRVRLSAEKQMLDLIARLIESVSDENLKSALKVHRTETENHITRLDSLLSRSTADGNPIKSKAASFFKDEVESAIMDTASNSVRDAALIGVARRMQQYEVTSYDEIGSWAKTLKLDADLEILNQILRDEESLAQKLMDVSRHFSVEATS